MIRTAIQSKPKTRKCKVCPETFTVQRMGQRVCGPKCAVDLARIDREKKEADERRESRAADRKRKEEMKTKSDWLKEAQVVFNRWIRARDEGRPCISCGNTKPTTKYNAGHYLSVGAHPALRFIEDNAHLQCEYCNTYLSGNIAKYRPNLIAKIGIERVEWLEGPHEAAKYTIEDAKQIKAEYTQKLKALLAARAGMGE